MSYFPQDSREPLHDGGQWHESHQRRQYQERPPMVERTNNAPAANPLLYDDTAFHKAAEALLVRLKRSGMTGEKFIYSSKMTPLDRSQFAAAFAKRYKNFPLFPAPNESKVDIVMRRIQNEFGKAFLKVVIPEQDAEPQQQQQQQQQQQRTQTPNYQHHPEAAPQSTNYQPRQHPEAAPQRWGGSPEHGFYQRYEAPRYDPRYNREEMVQSPQTAYSNYRDASPQAYTPPPYQQQHYRPTEERRQRRQQSFDSSQQSPRGAAPTSILKTKRPLTRNPVAQIMEVLPPAVDTTPASIPVTMSGTAASKTTAVMKNQSSTRQTLMQEIEYITQLMGSATDSNDKATYASHLNGIKRQLVKLTSKSPGKTRTTNRSNSVLEIDQVLEPKKAEKVIRATTKSGGEQILEMEKVIPPSTRPSSRGRSERRSSERLGVGKSPKRWRLRSRSRSKERRKSLQTAGAPSFEEQPMREEEMESQNEAAIPKVILAGSVEPHHTMRGSTLDRMQDPVSVKPPMIRVKAPANLPPGYQLDAECDNQTFVVTVPQGGVAKGQVFESIAKPAKPTMLTPSNHERRELQHQEQYSTWKGGVFECCTYGVDHPMFCNSFFCPQVALTQIMTRMKLSAYGERVTSAGSRLKMKTVLLLSSCYALLNLLLLVAMLWSPRVVVSIFAATIFGLTNAPALFAFIYVVVQTRRSIRAAEQIPEERCEGCEDLLISVWCTPCTVAQMMRQTADYDTYRAVWFSESGLPNHLFVDKDQPTMMPTIV